MAILKCKMCGGDIILSEDKTFGTCDSCGSTMTFPKVSDEHKLNLYNRANHFRRQNEFDKAIAAYDKILDQDDTDAEAHWGAVLSRYGIEYVEDPATHERIPTCHRVQAASILSDPDYLSALEYAPDTASRDIYEQEARRIAEIQKGILAISSQEKPYDVFICYKETDEAGQRTRDSALAQEIYYQLTNEGYKVFFSRITLEDKLGQEYEPYIFAALNSARVMLVIGTKPEFFNAVWVKNEWSRYLALMKNDRTRLLIPCYQDMDPYDLPEELSALQSQDMSKIGFIQDITRGIKKVLSKPEPKPQPVMQQAPAATTNIENLMKRARLFMEDGDFTSANEYLDKVLDENAEYAPAYVGKVCTALGFRKEEQLAEATFLYLWHPDWEKALRFANPQQKTAYEAYYEQTKGRVIQQIRDYAFDCAMEMAVNPKVNREQLNQELKQYIASCKTWGKNRANGNRRENSKENEESFLQAVEGIDPGDVSEQAYNNAAQMFKSIGERKADICADNCLFLAAKARRFEFERMLFKILPDGTLGIEKYVGEEAEVTIPSSIRGYHVTQILDNCFYACNWLTKITISSNVTIIGNYSFYDCKSLTDITIPEGVISIGDYAFSGCNSLSKIMIPDSLTSIGKYAFWWCTSLKDITIPNGVKCIEDKTFSSCDKMTNVTISKGVTSIGNEAFSGCDSLTELKIPDGVIRIGDNAFKGCFSMTKLTIPDSVISIGDYKLPYVFNRHLHISGTIGSKAESFAKKYSISFFDPITEKQAEERKQIEEEKHRQVQSWQINGLCTYCGGSFNIFKKCKQCGRKKDY